VCKKGARLARAKLLNNAMVCKGDNTRMNECLLDELIERMKVEKAEKL
jgi:hypothetical protein